MAGLWLKISTKIDSIFYITNTRLAPLDGVRSLAIILVILRHCFDRPLKEIDLPIMVSYLLSFGWIGVQLFFTLSGFLIGGMIYKKLKEQNFSMKEFYIKRAFRILPLAYIYLLIVHWSEIGFDKVTLYNFLFLTNYRPGIFANHYWSLNVEEHFYLIFPLLFLFLLKRFSSLSHIIISFCTLILIEWIGRICIMQWPTKYLFPNVNIVSHWQADYLLVGVLAAILYHENKIPANRHLSRLFLILPVIYMLLSIITATIGNNNPFINQDPQYSVYLAPFYALFSFSFVLLAVTQKNLLTRLLSLKLFRWIGILSFSFNVHMALVYNFPSQYHIKLSSKFNQL